MAMYCIIVIKMRMLQIKELKRIMGFPEDYVLIGTQSEQKKYIGNAVEVSMARVLCEAIAIKI
jgi:DNA (cytosine-5)-methyltransferase 1